MLNSDLHSRRVLNCDDIVKTDLYFKQGHEADREHSQMQGCTCWKQALVRSPNKAKELCRTSGVGSCIHWYSSCIMLELTTRFSMWLSSPSASPESRSSATIMKSLSGASNCSGCCMWACNRQMTNYRSMTTDKDRPQRAGLRSKWNSQLQIAHRWHLIWQHSVRIALSVRHLPIPQCWISIYAILSVVLRYFYCYKPSPMLVTCLVIQLCQYF